MIKTNSHGFRANREYSFEKSDGKKRILVLGDSFVWGWGVENEEMFTEILEKELGGTEVLNAGHTGFDTLQEFLLYKRIGIRYEPDLVLLCFFPNDITDIAGSDELKPKASIENGQLILSGRTGLQDPVDIVWWEIKRYSKGLQYLEYVGSVIGHVSRRIKWAREVNANDDAGGAPVEEAPAAPYDYPVEYKIPQPVEFDKAWRIVGYVVAAINEMQRKIGGELKVVMVPEKRLVSADSKVLGHPQEHGNLLLMHDKMREICGPLGIEIIDMLPGFREDPDPLHFYFKGDTHWNSEGHRLAAKILLGHGNLSMGKI
jgi:hypothetical protein